MQHQVRQTEVRADRGRVGGDGGRKRMGGIDDGADLVVHQPLSQSHRAAKPADADLAHRQCRVGHPARQ